MCRYILLMVMLLTACADDNPSIIIAPEVGAKKDDPAVLIYNGMDVPIYDVHLEIDDWSSSVEASLDPDDSVKITLPHEDHTAGFVCWNDAPNAFSTVWVEIEDWMPFEILRITILEGRLDIEMAK